MHDALPHLTGTGEERTTRVFRESLVIVPATLLAIALANAWLPPPELGQTAERLAFTARWLLVALLPYLAAWLTIIIQRLLEGEAHNPLLGKESHRLEVHRRVMQNTLEQFVILAVCLLAAAGTLPAHHLDLVPILCTGFLLARIVYWRGYLDEVDCLKRTRGTQMTTAITSVAFVFAARGLWQQPWG